MLEVDEERDDDGRDSMTIVCCVYCSTIHTQDPGLKTRLTLRDYFCTTLADVVLFTYGMIFYSARS